MDWRSLHGFGAKRGAEFYLTALTYAQYLYQRSLPARALLALDRAFGADPREDSPVLGTWPMPYRAVAWIVQEAPPGAFLGNPRIHFQHLADRLGPPRRDQRSWRAWACWELVRRVRPDLPGDPGHPVTEPSRAAILAGLTRHGLPGEAGIWQAALDETRAGGAATGQL